MIALVLALLAPLLPSHPACDRATADLEAEAAARIDTRAMACLVLVTRAARRGLPVALVVAVAMQESRLDPRAFNATTGAAGILQAIPRWWCPESRADGCDLVDAGLRALDHYGLDAHGLCRYASGNTCRPAGEQYARAVLARAGRYGR